MMAPAFAKAVRDRLPADPRFLEVGAGTASASEALQKLAGGRFVASDLTAVPLRAVQPVAWGALQGDMLKIPFCDQSFDFIWTNSTLEHFPEPRPVLREMARVGRTVAASVPGTEGAWSPLLKSMEAVGYEGTGEWYMLYSHEAIRRLFLDAGFSNVEIRTIRFLGVFPFHVAIGDRGAY